MYTNAWNKYLPVLKILVKRALQTEQKFQLNLTDFEKLGPNRKAAFKFSLRLKNGKIITIPSAQTVMSKDLATVLLSDPVMHEWLKQNEIEISLNSKFILTITNMQEKEPRPDAVLNDQTPNL
jgi:hypothetical protein